MFLSAFRIVCRSYLDHFGVNIHDCGVHTAAKIYTFLVLPYHLGFAVIDYNEVNEVVAFRGFSEKKGLGRVVSLAG